MSETLLRDSDATRAARHRPTDRLLPLLQVLALLALACVIAPSAMQIGTGTTGGDRSALVATLILAGTGAVVAVCWGVRARTRSHRLRAVLSVVVVVLVIPLVLYGTFGFVYSVLLLALALLVLDVSRRAGAIGWAATTLLAPVVLVVVRAPWPEVLGALVGMGSLGGFSFALGVLWRGFEEREAEGRRLLAERDGAVADLEHAMVRLRRAADTEKELVLADERTRAARDLHDGLGHRLTLIAMSLEFADRTRERDPRAAWSEVAMARATTVEAMEEMRMWVRALSPVRDADATGLAAFEAIADSFRGTGLDVTVRRRGDAGAVDLEEDASLLLYRAVQEGLTNALRHSRARTVSIEVDACPEVVTVEVTNDLAPERRDAVACGAFAPGFGLRGLTERAEAIGGSVRAERDGDVVRLRVQVPTATAAVGSSRGRA